jgi:hypothetical protein
MALPKLNSSPKYELTIPSTGQSITYRPYLVKEEKVLMIAFESGDVKQAVRAIADTLEACITEDIQIATLATFDVEYIFTQVRAKSVGERATILLACSNCQTKNEYEFDISSIEVNIDPNVSSVIELAEGVSVEMQYPQFIKVLNDIGDKTGVEDGFDTVVNSIKAILTEEERISVSDVSIEDINEFVESLTTEQFSRLLNFIKALPQIKHDAEYECKSCGTSNIQTLAGLRDFL